MDDFIASLLVDRIQYITTFTQSSGWQSSPTTPGEVLYGEIGDYRIKMNLLPIDVSGRIVTVQMLQQDQYSPLPESIPTINGACFNSLQLIDALPWQYYVMVSGPHTHGLPPGMCNAIHESMMWKSIVRYDKTTYGDNQYYFYCRKRSHYSLDQRLAVIKQI